MVKLANEQSEGKSALRGSDLYKCYRTGGLLKRNHKVVLDYLNINVREGQIYSLLGPSGCGKTTLLKCLLGLLSIEKGQIHIESKLKSGKNRFKLDLNKLGFMPQESCLFTDLRLCETFYYFGKLYSMTDKKIQARMDFLIALLDLPSKESFVSCFSGGQLRRASLAITLLNIPSILILDEPTVGMDPILRKKIWDFLLDQSGNHNTTIVITTHYIEEARRADWVGFMRQGKIIEENKPEYLMLKYKQQLLEDVFYVVCSFQSQNSQDHTLVLNEQAACDSEISNTTDEVDIKVVTTQSLMLNDEKVNLDRFKKIDDDDQILNVKTPSKNCQSSVLCSFGSLWRKLVIGCGLSYKRMQGNVYKDTLKCMRNKKLLLIQLIVPLVQIFLFCVCIGKTPSGLNIGYVNNEPGALTAPLGNLVLSAMDNNTVTKRHFFDFETGYGELKKGNIWCLIVIDSNFSLDIIRTISEKKVPYKFLNQMHLYMDNTNHQISLTIKDVVFKAVEKVVQYYHSDGYTVNLLAEDAEYNYDKQNAYPITFEKPVYGQSEPVFTHFMAPGIALSVIFFMSVASTASNFVNERRQGLIERSYLAGVKTIEILISQLFVFSLLMCIQVFIIMVLLFGFLRIPCHGSLLLLIILITSQGFCGLCYGLFLASIFYDEETVIQATLASFYPILLMSGIIWPIQAQPYWLKTYVSRFLPLTYASDSFRAILEKDWDLSNNFVMRGFLTTYIWTFCFCFGFLVMFTKKFRV